MAETTRRSSPAEPLRLWPGIVCAVLLVASISPFRCSVRQGPPSQVSRRTRWRAADPPVVAVLQPRAVVRAHWRDRADGCRAAGDVPLPPHLDCGTRGRDRCFPSSQSRPRVLRSSPGLSPPRGFLTAFAARRWSRRLLVACAAWTLLRTGGITGDGAFELHWRWTPSPEDRLLELAATRRADAAPTKSDAPAPASEPTSRGGSAAVDPRPRR